MNPQAVGIYIPKKYVGVYQTAWGATLYMNNPNSEGHNKGDILVVPTVNGNLNLTDCSPTNNAVFARTYDLTVGGWSNLGIKADTSKPFTLEDCKRLYQVPKTACLIYSFQGVLDSLYSKSLIPQMACAYYDLEESDTVWFETVGDSRVLHLSKDFYCGVVNAGDSLCVVFRNIMGDECDLDIEVKPTVESVQACISRVMTVVKQAFEDYRKTYNFTVLNYGDKNSGITGETMIVDTSNDNDSFSIGVCVGLKDSLLRSIEASSGTDAYLLITLTIAINEESNSMYSCIDVFMQGTVADNISKRIRRRLHCKATNFSDIKNQINSLVYAVRSR